MLPKKGDTLYDKRTGEPVTVRGTRKLTGYHAGQVRVYLMGRKGWGAFEVGADGTFPHYCNYTQTQTAELAGMWADTLAQREREQAEWVAQHERYEANVQKFAHLYDAPPVFGLVQHPERLEYGEMVQTFTYYEPERETGEPVQHKNALRVSLCPEGGSLFDDAPRRLLVNWSAMGSQSPALAFAYARLIIEAVKVAEEHNATQTTTEEPANA